MKIIVIGGAGLIRSKTVAASPKSGINTITGEGTGQRAPGEPSSLDASRRHARPDRADRTLVHAQPTLHAPLQPHE